MRTRAIIPILVISMFFLTAGVSLALPMPMDHDSVFEFYNSDGTTLGARIYADVSDPVDGVYTYLYQVQNVYFDPASDNAPGDPANEINLLQLSVAIPIVDAGWADPVVDAAAPVPYLDTYSGQIWFGLYYTDTASGTPGVLQGEFSDILFIESTFGPGEGLATLVDSGESSTNENVMSALVTPGGGPGEVPEPGTLLLVGSGLLGLGCLRGLIRSRRKSRS